jgi:hypothetical protein
MSDQQLNNQHNEVRDRTRETRLTVGREAQRLADQRRAQQDARRTNQ